MHLATIKQTIDPSPIRISLSTKVLIDGTYPHKTVHKLRDTHRNRSRIDRISSLSVSTLLFLFDTIVRKTHSHASAPFKHVRAYSPDAPQRRHVNRTLAIVKSLTQRSPLAGTQYRRPAENGTTCRMECLDGPPRKRITYGSTDAVK